MLNSFLEHLRAHRIPVSLREHLDLQHLFLNRLISVDVNEFYYLSRLCLIKDEKYFDRFDKAFAAFFDSLAQESFVSGCCDRPSLVQATTHRCDWFNCCGRG